MDLQFPRLDRGDLGLLILAALATGERYGYELVGELRRRSEDVLDLPEGTVYPALRRLEAQGLVSGRWSATEDGRRRRYYRLTPSGERALEAGRASWRRFVAAADGILGS